jgi:hypothetical protein
MVSAFKYEIYIDDKPLDKSAYPTIEYVKVEDNDTMADTFNIRMLSIRGSVGEWTYPQKDKFVLFNKVKISASFDGVNNEYLIEGYITRIDFHIDKEERKSHVDIHGMDATLLMNLEEQVVSWVDKSDSQIAREIFSKYGFDLDVDDTIDPPHEEGYTVIQRESDIEFLKRLAGRNDGFECFVDKDYQSNKTVGHFRKLKLDTRPQKDLAVQFGANSTISTIDFSIDGLRPLSVEMNQKDALDKEVKTVNIEDSKLAKLGKQNLKELIESQLSKIKKGGVNELLPKIVLSRHVVSEPQLMEAITRSVFDDGSWFISAKGTVNAEAYGQFLRAKSLGLIKGADDKSGKYYFSKVVHIFKPGSYVQEFKAKRNAIGLEGDEKFSNQK